MPRSRTATGVREEEKPIPKYWQNASRQHGGVQNSLKRGLLKFDTLSFQGGANVLGHKSADIAAHHGDLSDKCSADELKLFRRREEDRFNFRHEFWFIPAIWNSYSKSLTARAPRTMQVEP